METLFIYLIKSSGLLALFFVSYHFMLRKETFFTSNRWFLLSGLITSVVLPLVIFTKIIWVEPVVTNTNWSNIPASNYIEEKSFEDYLPILTILTYSLGILLLLAKFAYDFYSLQRVLKGKSTQQQADFKLIDIKENLAPFSYFNTIVYNSALYSPIELENILEHEKIHSEQHHTVDVLISRLFCIVFWFNPFIWLYKKAILQNLEFIADSEALKKISDKKAYQITLLKITTQENCVAITNHFYQSLIKKRIVMLNKNQSKKRNSWKYLSILPALVAFVFLFQIEVVAQEKVKETMTTVKESPDNDLKTELSQSSPDPIKKTRTVNVHSTKEGDNEKVKTIYIDGKEASQADLDALDPSVIKTMDVNKNDEKSTIKIITKNSNGIPNDTEIFINGKKMSKKELDELDSKDIETMDVRKSNATNSNKNTIRIITKTRTQYSDNKDIPTPPTPPTPPTFNFKAPKAPNFPKAPKAPKGDPITGDKKAWKDFDIKMEEFNKKMEAIAPEMEAFDKKMAEFDKQMEPFNAQMEIFEKKMKVFEKQMEEYEVKLNENK
ncbi:M56 family metallopeptidase [Flavobacterium sp. WC2416]|uniref:M56 family metallopeptidase n=1 Tax=Flavobacterium sp. WC2416 TaxID=3234141 RepID=A0AB39WAC8_9FLAO